jgi:chemotaxis signal transduction protein
MSAATGQSLAKVDSSRLQELRTSFDQTFAVAPRAEAEPLISLISVRVINKPFVLRSEHIIGIVKAKRITPFPSSIPECIGVAGIRGVLVPVFRLAGFLGLECPTGAGHWIVLANRESPIGFAFDEFEGQVEVARSALYSEQANGGSTNAELLARIRSSVRPVIDIAQIVQQIRNKAGLSGPARSNQL